MATILIISALQIFPPISGGHHRTATISKQLIRAGHTVRIYSLIGRKNDMLRLTGPGETVVSPNLVEFVRRPLALWLRAMIAYKRGIPPLWAKPFLQKGDTILDQWVANSEIIIFDFPYTFGEIGQSSQLLILNSHNVEANLFRPDSNASSNLSAKVRSLELSAIAGVDCVMCASAEEVDYFVKSNPNQQFLHVPNCISAVNKQLGKSSHALQLRQNLRLNEDETVLIFPASRYGPNEEGAAFLRQFCVEHEEFLRRQNMVIVVAGSVTPKADRIGQYLATGPVPDIEPFFQLADWGINPIFQGSGTSIKVAEFIGFGLPILTTPIGARGFKLEDNVSAVIFNRENLLEKLAKLPNDPDKISTMCKQSRDANLAFLDPGSAVAPLLEVIGKSFPPS